MTTTLFSPPLSEIPRDRWTRPLVVPPNGDKAIPYTRCTTYVGVLEDHYALGKWQQRKVAEGLASRPDYLLAVNALGPEPDKEDPAWPRWKKAMDEKTEAAIEAAKASSGATIGTALHALTERLDRGQDLGVVPQDYRGHIQSYAAATVNFQAVHIERFTVNDELCIGGTPDRVLAIDGLPGLYIGDLKTGTTEFGIGKMAMQLAVYSRSVLYNHETRERCSLGDVNQDRGLIVALSARTGKAELFWLDLAAGWEAVQIATEVRAWRAREKGLRFPYTAPAELAPVISQEAAASLAVAIRHATDPTELVQLWSAATKLGAWTAEHTALAAERKRELAAA